MSQSISLSERIEESIQSGQPGLWIRTHEPDEALKTLANLAKQYSPDAVDADASIWVMKIWDIVSGLQTANQAQLDTDGKPASALAAIKSLITICEERRKRFIQCDETKLDSLPAEDNHNIVLVMRNGHREFVNNGATNKEMLMAAQHLLSIGKAFRCHLVVMSFPGVEIPLELVEQVWVLDHELPDYNSRQIIITELLDCHGAKIPKADRLDIIVKATGGLTRGQVEGISALSLMKHDKILTSDVWRLKAESLNKRGLLQLWKGEEKFDSIGGLQGAKLFCKRALKPGKPTHLQARAALLLGVPGTGKSALCKAIGNEMNRPTLSLDIGGLMGSLVGQTEERTREALAIADAMEPCQLFLDEVEKALGGGGDNDGGVGSRMKGALLTWLNDHTSDVFLMATANDISKLPPEFTRAERFDAIFFMDLPSREQKDVIWEIYYKVFSLNDQERPADDEWTGAEIKACCRLSAMLEIPLLEAAKQVIPIMLTAREQIMALRAWAHKRCLCAETGEIYINPTMKGDPAVDISLKGDGRDLGERMQRRISKQRRASKKPVAKS